MHKDPGRSFLKGFLFSPILLGAALLLFVVLVDPFWRFNSPLIDGFNRHKIYFTHQARLAKAHQACAQKPAAAIFGSSRVEEAFMMDHPVWQEIGPALNMAMGGIMIDELYKNVKHTYYASGKKLKTAVVGLDFYAFNALRQRIIFDKIVVNHDENRLLLDEDDSCLGSFIHDADFFIGKKALKASAVTVYDQYHLNHGHPEYFQRNGAFHPTLNMLYIGMQTTPFRAGLGGQVGGYIEDIWRPEGSRRYCLQTPEFDSLVPFRDLVGFALDHDIDLRLFFSPIHAWMGVGLNEAGLYAQYQDWRKALVTIAAEEAETRGKPAFPIWDLAGFNPITTTPAGKESSVWYFEGSHYRPRLGDLVLDCIFGTSVVGKQYKKDFCEKVDIHTIESRNAESRKALFAYMRNHPEDAKEIKKIADAIFAKEPGSNCGPTYRFLEEAGRRLSSTEDSANDYEAVIAQARTLHKKEDEAHRQAGLVFREPDPAAILALQLAAAAEEAKKLPEAIGYYWRYVEQYPQAKSILEKIASLATAAQDYANAERALSRLIELFPKNDSYRFLRAQARMQMENWEGAIEDSNQGLALTPHNMDFKLFRGEAQLRLGRIREGRADLEEARQNGKDNAYIRRLLERYANGAGD